MKMVFQIFSIVTLGFWFLSSPVTAQGVAPFAGRGIEENQGSAPNWFGSSGSNATAEKSNSPGWFGQGILRSARPGEVENRPGLFGSLFQRPSNEPGLMQRATDKSREMVERTRNWAAEKNESIKMRTTQTWDNLTAGLRPTWDNPQGKEPMPAPFGAPDRMAENPNSVKTEKF